MNGYNLESYTMKGYYFVSRYVLRIFSHSREGSRPHVKLNTTYGVSGNHTKRSAEV